MTNPVHPDCARNVAEYLRQITGLGWDAPEDRGDGWRIQGSERDEAVFVRLEAGRLRMRGAFPASTYMLINVGISIHTRDYLVTVSAGRQGASDILARDWVAKRRTAYLAAMARVREALDREEAYEQQTEATRARLLEITGSNPDATRQGGYIYLDVGPEVKLLARGDAVRFDHLGTVSLAKAERIIAILMESEER